jgi:hypothetical protein
MSLKVSASNLASAATELNVHWQNTRASWRDAKALEFSQTYLEELPHLVQRANAVMNEIDNLLRKVKQDCE